MATGTPAPRRRASQFPRLDFSLTYRGKASNEEILAGPSAKTEKVVEVSGEVISRIIYGENLRILRTLIDDPKVNGQVRLVYIDPPFSSQSRFQSREQSEAYEDLLWGGHYLEFLRQRLILLRELLAEDGSIYVHLDDNMAFPVKVLLDEIFGPRNFRNWITRKKCNPKNYTRKQYGNVSDYILFYSKTAKYVWNQQYQPLTKETVDREYRHIEPETGRRYMKVPLHAPGVRNGPSGGEWRGMKPPPGKHWQFLPSTMEEMHARGEIYWSPSGNPRRKIYLDENKGVSVQDIWLEYRDAHNQNIRITGYPTEKNLELLKRIVLASSDEGDLVLDAFAGSGTTAIAAEDLGRPWLTIDNVPLAIQTVVERLAHGAEPMGDFVTPAKAPSQRLFEKGHLRSGSGVEIFEEESPDLEPLEPSQINEWQQMLEVASSLATWR
jgi:adenine-specific DNA-methyltransferase